MHIDIKNIKRGDTFWEKYLEFEAIEDAETIVGGIELCGKRRDQHKVMAKAINSDQLVEFFVTEGAEHYGPQLYAQNQYPQVYHQKLLDEFKK